MARSITSGTFVASQENVAAPAVDLGGWDVVRFLAFADVAAFHSSGVHLLAGIGLPVFFIVALSFGHLHARKESVFKTLRRRVERLGLAWLFWWVCYAAYGALSSWRHGESPFAWMTWDNAIAGRYGHLWFIPCVLSFTLISAAVERSVLKASRTVLLPACFAAFGLALLSASAIENAEGLRQWAYGIPALPLSVGVGTLLIDRRSIDRIAALLAIHALLCFAFALHPNQEVRELALRYGIALVMLASSLAVPGTTITHGLRKLLLGCYLVHPLVFAQTVYRIWPDARAESTFAGLLAQTAVGVPATVLVVWMLRRTKLERVL